MKVEQSYDKQPVCHRISEYNERGKGWRDIMAQAFRPELRLGK